MSRISNNTFKVNNNLEQMTEIASVANGVVFPISTGSTLDVDVVANTAGLATSVNQSQANASLANIDLNTTGLATESTATTIAGDTTSLDAKITNGSGATLPDAQQVGVYGWDGANWRQANVSSGGNLKVESELEDHSGSQGNLQNGAYTDGSFSTAIDTSNHTLLTLFGNKTDTSNSIQPQISANGSNYYDLDYEIYPKFSNGDFYATFSNVCANNFRLKFNGNGTATATLLHNNH